MLTDEGWDRLNSMAKAHVESVRRHLLDVMAPDEFAALGVAMGKVRDAALGIHQAVVEECAEAELEEDLDVRATGAATTPRSLAGVRRDG